MCGIFGAVGPIPDGSLERVSQILRHRGPDAEGRFADADVSLLHRRLSILDLSPAGAQPMFSDDHQVVLVFNGEIYNHHSLRRELGGDAAFRSRSDTEAIVRGYERWGDGVVEKLDGMFAFGLWDLRKRRLLLARDRTGKKPLFVSERGRTFRFGSSIAALRTSGLTTTPAVEQLSMYLAYGYVPAPDTLHEGVEQLEPGQLAVYESGTLTKRTYWQPHFDPDPAIDSYEDAKSKVNELVTAAIVRRLESDVPLGAFLSGGIDSTIVAGVMAQQRDRVRTFSIGFAGDPRFDETHFARMAAKAFGTEHTEFVLEPSSFQLVEELVAHHDGPFGDSSAIPTYVVSKLTRDHVTVALTGDGGDELFCGYYRFLAAEATELIPQPLRATAARFKTWLPSSSNERSLWARGRRFLDAAAEPLADRSARWSAIFPRPGELLSDSVVEQLGAANAFERPFSWQREQFARCKSSSTLAKILEHNFRTYLPYDLLVKADRCSMAASLETRSPFLDTELIEYAARLPASYLRRGRYTKRILKDAFADLIPAPIRTRGKMGFGVPLGTWFRGDLRTYLLDHVGRGAKLDAYLSRPTVDRLLAEHAEGKADHGHRLWSLLTLEIWLRSLSRPT